LSDELQGVVVEPVNHTLRIKNSQTESLLKNIRSERSWNAFT